MNMVNLKVTLSCEVAPVGALNYCKRLTVAFHSGKNKMAAPIALTVC